ncbi:hypothetical protein AYI68_g1752 [Smittium mucronatum]|uniref:Uncharacterized protein n=1 Tax=Smittium mucronatum TaxID=133383 RepID=A0A1R0H4L6_9FUNG|nr:hypothetical protein AYI68_g1752 [Smittium mucronatum]
MLPILKYDTSKETEITELRNQLIQGESQFQSAAEEHQDVLSVFKELNSAYESEFKKNAELNLQMTIMENVIFKRELELANLKAELLQKINILQSEGKPNLSDTSCNAVKQISKLPAFEVVEALKGPDRDWYDAEQDTSVSNCIIFKEALTRQHGSLESTDQALERIYTLKITMKSEFNSFIQQIRPSIKLISGDNDTLAIAILRKQVGLEIRKYVPKLANESFKEHEKRLKAHMYDSQEKFTSHRSKGMEIDSYSAAIQSHNYEYSITAAQYVNNNRRPQSTNYYQRNPFKRSVHPHNRENTTMTKDQFDEYVKQCTRFNCGIKGHLRSACLKLRRSFRSMNVALIEDSGKEQAQ